MNQKPLIALLYDFDKTLCTTDMEDYSFIPSLGYTPAQFWQKANNFGWENQMDGLLAYMYTMIEECRAQGKTLNRDYLVQCGKAIELFPGVREWFDRIDAFGDSLGVTVEHYVLSQFVYRINKGVLEVSEDKKLNDSMPDDSKRIPFTNMIYVGDGLSDVPCMKMMRSYGGQAIAVYQESNRTGVEELLARGRVDFIFPADYRAGTALDITVQNIIRKMAICDALTAENAAQMRSIGQVELAYQETLF